MLAQIDIRAKLNLVSFTNIFPKLEKFDTNLYTMGYGAPTMDAFAPMQSLLQSVNENRTGGSTSTFGQYANRQLDALLDKIKREPDMKVRDTEQSRRAVCAQ